MTRPVGSSFANHFKFWDNLCRDSPGARKCGGCGRIVYVAEQIVCMNKVWHRSCLQCSKCKNRLLQTNYNDIDHVLFCEKCYRQELATKYASPRRRKVSGSAGERRDDSVLENMQNLSLGSSASGHNSPALISVDEHGDWRNAKSDVVQTNTEFVSVQTPKMERPLGDRRKSTYGTSPSTDGYWKSPISGNVYRDSESFSDILLPQAIREPATPAQHHHGLGRYNTVDAPSKPKSEPSLKPAKPPTPIPARRFSIALGKVVSEVNGERLTVRQMAEKINKAGARGVIGVQTHHFCGGCRRTVHPEDGERCLGRTWHRLCIRCSKCHKDIQSSTGYFEYDLDDALFCESCHAEEWTKIRASRRKTLADLPPHPEYLGMESV